MRDEIVKTDKGSVLQHGKYNDRIFLMKIVDKDIPGIIEVLNELARKNNYGKIFARIPLWALPLFKADGYITEAHIPGFIRGKEDIYFVSKFLNSDRLLGIETEMLTKLSNFLLGDKGEKTYPFPIHDPDFIRKSMRVNTRYFDIKNKKNEYIAVSSAEIEPDNLSAEMTDF
ncbi:MAG: hypothetical protein U9N72_09330 [Bacteroidota bacterium]|nr:hypothetical protein [Bacteroidota bacterium]